MNLVEKIAVPCVTFPQIQRAIDHPRQVHFVHPFNRGIAWAILENEGWYEIYYIDYAHTTYWSDGSEEHLAEGVTKCQTLEEAMFEVNVLLSDRGYNRH